MKVAFFSAHLFEREFFISSNQKYGLELAFFEPTLNQQTVLLTSGFECICCFVNDQLDFKILQALKQNGVRLIALRSAGYNNVDLQAADRLGLTVVRVPGYSPHAVAEYSIGLLLSLVRKIHKAYIRVRDLNFSLEGLIGFDLYQKIVGVIGTGRIGQEFATIIKGFGCQVIAYDPKPNSTLLSQKTVTYVPLGELYRRSDIISLHLPLFPNTKHIINAEALAQMKKGVILINTGRGGLIDSVDLIESLKSGHLGGAGLDVYEEEEGVFFENLSDQFLKDDVLARLLTFPNVLITSHQGFLTKEALKDIAAVTLKNISDFKNGSALENMVHAKTHLGVVKETSGVTPIEH